MLTAKVSNNLLTRFSRLRLVSPVKYFSAVGSETPHYDVIIAGGGLVGVSLAVSIGKFISQFVCLHSAISYYRSKTRDAGSQENSPA